MLDTQIHMYAVDTGHFYSNTEKYLHDRNCRYRKERNYIKNKLPELEKKLQGYGYTAGDIKAFRSGCPENALPRLLPGSACAVREYQTWNKRMEHKRKKAQESKNRLLALLANKVGQNERTGGRDHIRRLREQELTQRQIISVFESALTRTAGIQKDELTDALLIVQVYYLDVFKDLSFYGFLYKGEAYQYFTSSAGQIRQKKAVFIKKSVWKQIERTIMCGLTIDKINAKGGNNVNKHLAYLALSNSATDAWPDFDIDRCIVIDDFETNVPGTFDFVEESDYTITRKYGSVPIMHTDGAGMVLPSLLTKNTMFRAPWIKGLLGVFDFRRFIDHNGCSPMIRDIYGKEHDVIEEDIQIIFTRSQFKMYRYYESWDEYKAFFKEYHCLAGTCNTEEDRIRNAKINYQMLQTLTDVTEEEMELLASRSVRRITDVCASEKTMMEILGVTPYNTHMTAFQKAIKLYPSLLNDTYAKDVIREVKNSLLKKYRSGKLEINGKYTFLLPDFYAACEYWFEHIRTPSGLLAGQEVFCRLYKQYGELDCLRSPHLYKEHAIRSNAACREYTDRAGVLGEWFPTNAIYTSSHDFISKILQFDVDGDRSLVVADKDFVRIAKRNMAGVAPLYYNMRKAGPTELNPQTIYAGLNAAFTHGNIGVYSNQIAKIWNSDVFLHGTGEEKQEAETCIKLLCMENNFCIDAAKTLYMPARPQWFHPVVSKFTSKKLPGFFEFAKDKDKSQIEERNGSFVNRLYDLIPDKPIRTRGLNLGTPDYRKLMKHPDTICSQEVSALYNQISREFRFQVNQKEEYADNFGYLAGQIREKFRRLEDSDEAVTDMLVEKIYGGNSRRKQLLWFCYGSYMVQNLEQNLERKKTKYISCVDCGEWMEVDVHSRAIRCDPCAAIAKKAKYARYNARR